MPSAAAVAALEAEPATEEQQQEWRDMQAECRHLAVEIHEHAWWGQVDDRKAARKALDEAVSQSG